MNQSEKYIYKFGGIVTNTQLSKSIERYNPKTNQWEKLEVLLDPYDENVKNLKFAKTPVCVLVNPVQVFIFGGTNLWDDYSTDSYFFNIFEEQ